MDLRDRAADFRFLVRDWARQFTASSDTVLASAGIQAVQIRPEVLSRTPMSNGSVCDEALAGVVRVAELGEVLLVEQGHPQRPVIGGELADGGGAGR
jgi:hypothetical protein